MAFKIRRGTNAERLTITPAQGELIYTTDTKKLYVGDGTTVGGVAVDQGLATTTYVDNAINDLVDGAASTLDTLKELADALGSDPNFAGNLTTALADKVNSADLATVATSGDYDDLTNKPNIFSGDYDDLSNKPTIPSISGLASETYVDNKVSDLVNGASSTLDTLKELADALGNDQNFATTVTNSLANKANVVDLSAVATSGDYDDLTNKPNVLINSDTGTLTPGDMFFTQTNDTVSMGSLAAQNITAGPSGIQIAGTGGVTIMGVATAGVTLGGGTSGAIDFASGTTGIDYNDLDNKPSIPDLGNVAQDILPTTDVTYDLGSPTKRFKDLYLSNNTLYLGDDAISVDNVYGLALKQPGGGEGYGAGYVAWTDQDTLFFGGVEVTHPLYGYLEKLSVGDKIKELAPGDADFTLTVTGALQFGPDVGGFKDVTVPVDQSKSQDNVGSNYYVYVVEFIKPVNNFNNLENSPLVANSNGWYDIDPNGNKSIGLQEIVGDATIYVRPSWNRTPTVDFQFKENGTIQLPPGGDIVDSAGVSVLGGGTDVSHVNITGIPYAGSTVTFVHSDNGTEVDVLIPDDGSGSGVGITRDSAGNGIYNPYREGTWDDTVSPGGTLWNIDGWTDFTDVPTRTYSPLYAAFGSGGLGNKIVGTECVMYLPDNGKYYAVKFSAWTQGGNGGGFAYTRRELDLTNLQEGITFPDGTILKSAEGIGRVKSIASGDRRIEEVVGNNTVSVTEITPGVTQNAVIRQSSENWDFYVNATPELTQLYDNPSTFNYLEFSFDAGQTWIKVGFGGGQRDVYYQMVFDDNVNRPVTVDDVVSYRTVTGGTPVVWWDKNSLPGGSSNFRGAIIDYHAYTGESTIIGTIHIVDDDGEEHISHQEVASGSTDGENDDLWLVQNEGTISYRRIDGEEKTLKVHWTAKVFYGSEYYD